MKKYEYSGLLSLHSYGEADDILFLSSIREPVAEELGFIQGKQVTARYWITDRECTKDEANDCFMKEVMGYGEADFGSRYSECTGYLWTDEELNIGGHDLIEELNSYIGKWLILEIEVH